MLLYRPDLARTANQVSVAKGAADASKGLRVTILVTLFGTFLSKFSFVAPQDPQTEQQ